jgi:hypothetical protein
VKLLFLSLWTCTLAFAVNVALGELENGYVKSDSDPQVLTISVISSTQANDLFRKFVGDPNIPFKYPIDGCYARATAMAQMAEADKITMGKVYAEGFLQAKTDSVAYPIARWGWHVAPVAYVKKADGKIDLMVFDPSLFNKPVGIDEWKSKMLDKSDGAEPKINDLYYGTRYQYYRRRKEGYKSAWDRQDLDDTKDTMSQYLPLQDIPSRGGSKVDGMSQNIQMEF